MSSLSMSIMKTKIISKTKSTKPTCWAISRQRTLISRPVTASMA